MVHSCVVCFRNSKTSKNISFHLFPKNPVKSLSWVNALNLKMPIAKWRRICSDHFDKGSFIFSCSRKILLPNAVPSLSNNVLKAPNTTNSEISKTLFSESFEDSASNESLVIGSPLPFSYNDDKIVHRGLSTANNMISKKLFPESFEDNVSDESLVIGSPLHLSHNNKKSVLQNLSSTNTNVSNTLFSEKQLQSFDSNENVDESSRKKRKYWNSSRFGDLNDEDFSTPRRRKKNLMVVCRTVSNLRHKNKLLLQKNKRL